MLFQLELKDLHWISGGADDPQDFCLHGRAIARIGSETLKYDATVSAAALYLLRTLTEDHIAGKNLQLFPCCGHSMFPAENGDAVLIVGCGNGADWTVRREGAWVRLITPSGTEVLVPLADYQHEVFCFADQVEAFYRSSAPKDVSSLDELEREGYAAFWREWHKRRDG